MGLEVYAYVCLCYSQPYLGNGVCVNELVGEEDSWVGLHNIKQEEVVQLTQYWL